MAMLDPRWRSENGWALSVVLCGLLITGAGAFFMAREITSLADQRFAQAADRVANEIEGRLQQSGLGLSGVRAFFIASGQVSRRQFQTFVAARNLPAEFPGVRGFGLIQRIARKDQDLMVQAERADGAPGFAIRQLDDKDLNDLLVIRFIEPAAWNQGAQGLDIGSERVRRSAAEHAIATGQPAMTENVVLVQDNQRTAGALLFVPLYRPGMPVTNALERRAALIGLLFSPIVVSELMQGIAAAEAGDIEFQLFDTHTATGPDDSSFYASGGANVSAVSSGGARFKRTQVLSLAQRDIRLHIAGTPLFESAISYAPAWGLLIAGSFVSFLLGLLLRQQASGRRRAEELAQEMTQDLDRLAAVVRHTSNSVCISDSDQKIIWINEGFTRISGYAMHEARGKTPGELLGSGETDPLALQTLFESVAAGESCRVEILNRAKSGRQYWIDTEVQPMHDAQGRLTGFMEIGSDITTNKAIEQELAHERRTLANIIEGTHAGTWEWNAATGEIRVNARWAAIMGYALGELDFSRIDTWRGFIHPADKPRSQSLINHHFQGELPAYECEIRVRHKHGHWVWVMARGKLISHTSEGMPEWMAGINLDINLRKQAEAALHESDRVLRLVTENMGGQLAYFDNEQRLRFANKANYDFFGGTPQSLIGCRFDDILSPKQMAHVGDAVNRVLAGEPQAYESETVLADGQTKNTIVHLVPDLQGTSVRGFVVLAVDVTLAKQEAQQLARQADTLLRTALEAAGLGLVLFDAQERLVFCNENYRSLYEGDLSMLVKGSRFGDILQTSVEHGLVPDATGRESEWVARRLARFREASGEHLRQMQDGRSVRMIERKLPGGHFVGLHLDISDLVRATEAAQESSRAKGQFLANMSHEIRTPMNAILGLLALLRRTQLGTRQADYAVKTENAARAMLGLLDDVLDFSRVESGKMALERRPFELDDMLQDLSVILAAGVGNKHLEVLFDVDPAIPSVVVGDKLRLQQVLVNLGGNAVKFTEHGEVVLSLQLLERSDSTAVLEFAIRDTGIGIDTDYHTSIFSAFSQAEGSITRRFGGTGLGLSISSKLVQLMGGKIEVQSRTGEGSRFSFAIPLELPSAPASSAPELPVIGPPTQAMQVLVVDDNAAAQDMLQMMGESLGWAVAVAERADRGLAMLAARAGTPSAFQVVLMDWQMPGMDGWQACERIRQMDGCAQSTLILMVSAHGREMLAHRSNHEKDLLNGYLVKPITASMLKRAVDAARFALDEDAPEMPANPVVLEQRLPGLRVLLAEDNQDNQEVMRELLNAEGAIVNIASHGQAAIDILAVPAHVFDVVLMDLQMPVMDGLTATRHIRSKLGLTALPIVAMTANAMASDREACRAAGMNDHVGKPFELDTLIAVLRRQCGLEDAALPAAAPANHAWPVAVETAATESGIDLQAAVRRMGGRTDVYLRMLRLFGEEVDRAPQELHALQTTQDTDAIGMLLHSLRGQSASLGASRLSAGLAEVEMLLRQQPRQVDNAIVVEKAVSYLLAARPAVQMLLQALAGKPAASAESARTETPTTNLKRELQRLADQLRESDMAATDTIQDLCQRYGGHPVGRELRAAQDTIDRLDFPRAMQLCDELIEAYPA